MSDLVESGSWLVFDEWRETKRIDICNRKKVEMFSGEFRSKNVHVNYMFPPVCIKKIIVL